MPDPQPQVPDGPGLGVCLRQWPKAIEGEQELRRLYPAPRLRYAIDHGWQPGLYLAEDLVLSEPPPQARRGVFGFPVPSPLLQEIAAGSPRWALPGDATARSDRPIRSAAHYGPSAWWMDQPDL